jgi:hypothetical protein
MEAMILAAVGPRCASDNASNAEDHCGILRCEGNINLDI